MTRARCKRRGRKATPPRAERGLSLADVAALSPAGAARILTERGGCLVTESMIRDDVADGAPANADGTIDLVTYGAWLLKVARTDDEAERRQRKQTN